MTDDIVLKTGVVKFYSLAGGYGFIVDDETKDTVLTVNNFFHYFSSKIIKLVFIFALKGASFLSTP